MDGATLPRSTAERTAGENLLASAETGPAALIIEGEAGIGKTTVWLSGVEAARERGFRVLTAQVGETETVLAYAAVGDLLGDVEPAVVQALPGLQRLAIDRVLLQGGDETPQAGQSTDQRVVAAAFTSVIEALAAQSPVVLAIDDVQWLDPSSRTVVAYAARRLRGRVGILFSERCDPDRGTARSWLQLGESREIERIRLAPMNLGRLHAIVSAKLGKVFSRPVMVRITEISGGNPFYALELARAIDGRPLSPEPGLPSTLAELVRLRIGRLDGDVRNVLLAIACVAAPTVDLLARLDDATADHVVDLLEGVETDGIVSIDGNQIRFTHPLLARGVYNDAAPASRRAMHRALAAIESEPELKARHLALSAASSDDATLAALDSAADSARARGAPAAAAELLDFAIGLGGDKPWRRIRAAGDHFHAGNTDHAESLLEPIVETLRPGMLRAIALNLLAAIHMFANNFKQANDLLTRAVDDAAEVPPLLVTTLMNLSFTQSLGSFAEGTPAEGMLDASLESARRAKVVADETGIPALRSQATAIWVHVNFMHGHGTDHHALRSALDMEPVDEDIPIPFNASAVEALLYAYTGELDTARDKMHDLRLRCIQRGADRNMMGICGYGALIDMWSGNFAAAKTLADEAVERAQQLGSGHVDVIAMSIRAAVNAHAGRVDEARADAEAALVAVRECDAPRMAEWPLMSLAFVEVSQGNYAEALSTLTPMLARFDYVPGTEVMSHWFVPNAVEAMIALDRLDEAEPLIATLEHNGARLDRSWNIAAGARCRGMWLAAKGDVAAAVEAAQRAIAEHDRLPMPFERARSQLLLGKLQRRSRHKEAAHATLCEALAEFDRIGAPLWVKQVRAELARTNVRPTHLTDLTPSERSVAKLAATGMSNKDIAASLFIGTKTVERNLTRIYLKLGIRSRVELARRYEPSANDTGKA